MLHVYTWSPLCIYFVDILFVLMPKKSKGSDGTPSVEEYEALRQALIKLEEENQAQRKEARALKGELATATKAKIAAEQELESVKKDYELANATLAEELETVTSLQQFQSIESQRKLGELEYHVAGFDTIQSENEKLKDRVKFLEAELSELNQAQLKETNKMKREAVALRMQLEQTFRNSLHEMNAKYHEKAYADMAEESKSALIEQAKLKEELAIQVTGIHAMMQRYDQKDAMAKRLAREKEILEETRDMNVHKIAKLKREVKATRKGYLGPRARY